MLDLFATAAGHAKTAAPLGKKPEPSLSEKKSTNSPDGTPPPKNFQERAGNIDQLVDEPKIHFDPCKEMQAHSPEVETHSPEVEAHSSEVEASSPNPETPSPELEKLSPAPSTPKKERKPRVKRVSAMVKAPTAEALAEEGCIVEDADDPRRTDKWDSRWRPREGHPSKRGWQANISAIHLVESKVQLPKPDVIYWKERHIKGKGLPWEEAEPDVLKFVAAGGTMAAYCQASGMSYLTLMAHIKTTPSFKAQVTEARQAGADALAAEALAIASNPMPTEERITVYDKNDEVVTKSVKLADNTYARKLAFQARMMLLEKWAPEKYGPNAKAEVSGGMAEKLRAARERIRSDLRASKKAAKASDAS